MKVTLILLLFPTLLFGQITAREAYNIAKKKGYVKTVLNNIELLAENGKYAYNAYNPKLPMFRLKPDQVQYLKDLGYKVTYKETELCYCLNVSWEEPEVNQYLIPYVPHISDNLTLPIDTSLLYLIQD